MIFQGIQNFLAFLTDTKEFRMSFFGNDLRVVLLSTHHSLRNAIDLVEKDRLIELINFSSRELGRLLNKKIRLAVAGLNPHASEGGMFGSEEQDEIIPAIEHCRDAFGIDVTGPYSPDTIFLRGSQGEFDAVVASISRSGDDPCQIAGFRVGCQCNAWAAFDQNVG